MKRKYLLLFLIIFILPFSSIACTNSGSSKESAASSTVPTGSAVSTESSESSGASTETTSASAATDPTAGYQTISPAEAKKLIGTEGVVLVDVRTQDEYDAGYIEGAILLPVDELSQKAESVLKDKNAKIIVYCRSGRRSAIAAKELLTMGYRDVYDLGGIVNWPYETVKK